MVADTLTACITPGVFDDRLLLGLSDPVWPASLTWVRLYHRYQILVEIGYAGRCRSVMTYWHTAMADFLFVRRAGLPGFGGKHQVSLAGNRSG